ncbi:photosystem II core complex proteins psbY, chloroplastic [Rhodamnia argentea]|uniref:Photosystem II core complex proteins psbY, chloroplastic n=1 Tax=Rhodamnia argentea TaxID=178133 RepID=A0A8B8Q4C3_9MYRT|nr:photosystem II core complex proteins psbY, chloroplastic [Rhodamnia argentea]
MAATVSTMAMLNAKCLATSSSSLPKLNPAKPSVNKPTFLNLPAGLLSASSKPAQTLAGSAIAGAVFSTLGHADPAFAAQQIAELAEGDNRGLALLLPIIPAVAWVLFNILQPALNQINRMRSSKGVIIGLGLGGLAGYGLGPAQEASAAELAAIAEASGSDSRGQLLLFVVAPAILWVLYNILQPALNQINRMRSQ